MLPLFSQFSTTIYNYYSLPINSYPSNYNKKRDEQPDMNLD